MHFATAWSAIWISTITILRGQKRGPTQALTAFFAGVLELKFIIYFN